jgi:hypothetical protein
VFCTHGLFIVHHLQRVEDIRLANECLGFLGLLHRRMSLPSPLISPVSPTSFNLPSSMAWRDSLLTLIQILFFITIYVLYQIKFGGWNPSNWHRRASRELQVPRPQVATSVPRRGHIALKNTDTLFTVGNAKQFGRWLWVWLK